MKKKRTAHQSQSDYDLFDSFSKTIPIVDKKSGQGKSKKDSNQNIDTYSQDKCVNVYGEKGYQLNRINMYGQRMRNRELEREREREKTDRNTLSGWQLLVVIYRKEIPQSSK